MHNQCVITFHLMITLKQNQVFRNQNLLDVSLPRIILLTKHVSFQVVNFQGLTVGFARLPTLRAFTARNMYNQPIESFTQGGVYPYLLLPDISFHPLRIVELLRTSFNSTQLTHEAPRMVFDGTMHLHP